MASGGGGGGGGVGGGNSGSPHHRHQSPSHTVNGVSSPNAFSQRGLDPSRLKQPHSMAGKKITLDIMWRQVEPGLTSVFQLKKMDKKGYMELYSCRSQILWVVQCYVSVGFRTVYSYCTSVASPPDTENDATAATANLQTRPPNTKKRASGTSSSPSSQATWMGMELYKKLQDFVMGHLFIVLDEIGDYRGEDLLTNYSKQWNNFRFSSKVSHGMCMYLNRHWVKRENDEGRNRDIYPVYGLCLVQWREHIFTPLENQLTRAVLDLISRERNGETVNSQLLRTIIDSLVELGVTPDLEGEDGLNPRPPKTEKEQKHVGLQVYKASFECRFLDESVKYYSQESHAFLSSNPVNEYIKKVLSRLAEEDLRCMKYLHETTAPQLRQKMEDVLIIQQMDVLHAEFVNLLAEEKVDELSSMYSLLCRVPNRIDDLYKLVEGHIRSHGAAAMTRNAEQLVNEPRSFVLSILAVYDRSIKLINGAFKGDHGFATAMDKAFGHLVNNNAVTQFTRSSSKISELLARHCDTVLKKSTKNPDELELEESLNRVMIIFRYVEEKDVFQKFYSKMLAKRLVQGLSASDDAEGTMISKLKTVCGFEYTSKLQRMFQDIGLSRDLNEQFRATNPSLDFEFEFVVQVLSTGAWPFTERNNLVLPTTLERPITIFRDFYHGKYNGRKLTWLFNLSRCELSASCYKNKYILQVSTYQAAILMCFNAADTCTVSQIRTMVECEQPFFHQVLLSLLKGKVLVLEDEAEEVEEKDLESGTALVKLNLAFKSKKLRINLNVPIRSEQKQEEDATNRVIEEDRKLLIQATIVRIMKMRKQLKHQQLVGETMQLLANRFKPGVAIIKKCVEILIQKGYMKRDEESKELYIYVA